MSISDLSVRRPVLAAVFCLLVIVFGAIAFTTLPLRELPDVDRPVVSVDVSYRGASAQVVETTVVRVIEDQLSGIEGVDTISANSRDGRGSINVEFELSRDLEDAANDVRNAVDRARGQLPVDIDPPVVSKQDADADPIIWINLSSSELDLLELTDYAERNLVDRLSTLPGVASVRVGGSQRKALRIWLDADALAARQLTVNDVEAALRSQNIETPAGYVESQERLYNVRADRIYNSPEEFARMAVGQRNGAVVRLGDVARIEVAPDDTRRMFRGNGLNQIGLGVVRQSKSNALEVAEGVRRELAAFRPNLPEGTDAVVAFDSTVFIDKAIGKVWETLAEAILLVVAVIVLFLGSFRAAAIPAAVIPVCLIGAFALLAVFGFSINLLTLLALVLSIGLVVDDSIVVLENIQRRMDQYREPAAVAAMRGTRQVFFAVVATSVVLVAVFAPLLFVGGYVGRLFIELAVTVAGVVLISMIAALTLTPMMCSKLLKPVEGESRFVRIVNATLGGLSRSYRASLQAALAFKPAVFVLFAVVLFGGWFVAQQLPSELTRPEDRGNLLVNVQTPEGSGFEYTKRIMDDVERVLLTYVQSGEATRILVVSPGFGDQGANRFNSGFGRVFLADWDERARSGDAIIGEMNRKLGEIPGAVVRVSMQNPLAGGGGGGGSNDVSIVLGGQDYEELADVADRVVARMRDNPNLIRPRMNYEPTNPRAIVDIDRERAAALGVSVQQIGRTLEATMGARRVNTITDRGREYYVYLQAERDERSNLDDLTNKYVRSETTGALVPLSAVVSFKTVGETGERRRLDRLAAVTIAATLAPGYAMGDALEALETAARTEIGRQNITIGYQGAAKQFRDSTGAILFAFGFALLIVFLVLAAQFESFVHPLVIMLTVPLAVAGGVFGLFLLDNSFNIYSQIGLIILIALAAKNGILIVEFANQLRDEGRDIRTAILEAADLRLRPILMTSLATVIGAVPLMLADGAGAEARQTIGVVIVFGVTLATMLTLFVVPTFYDILARFTRSPESVARDIERFESEEAAMKPAE
jgi:multidrug efflux pump